MKLVWEITEDGWTSERHLCLLENNNIIWRSKSHLYAINQDQFNDDFQFLMSEYDLDEACKHDIEERRKWGKIT